MRRTPLLMLAAAFALGTLSAAPGGALPLTIVTYNVGLARYLWIDIVPAMMARAKAAPKELARFAQARSPSLMMLEEVWPDRDADAIARELSSLGYTSVRPNVHPLFRLGSGLLLLVKAPLRVTDWKFTRYTKNTFTDSFTRKGILQVTIEDPSTGGRFALVGTHTVALDTADGKPSNKGQLAVHTAQAGQIGRALAERSEGGRIPAILLGDFNSGPGYAEEAYRRIAGSGKLVEAGAALSHDPALITWDPENPAVRYGTFPKEPPSKIDHIFLQDGDSARWTVRGVQVVFTEPVPGVFIQPPRGVAPVLAPLSDHYGFLAEVELSFGK